MLSLKDAGRLLKQDWKNPRELARELYAQVVSGSTKVVDSPVAIAAPPGQTALRLSRSSNSPRKPPLSEQRGHLRPKQASPQKAPDASPGKLRFALPPKAPPVRGQAHAIRQASANARVAARQQLQVSAKLASTESRRPTPRKTEVAQGKASKVQSGPGPQVAKANQPTQPNPLQDSSVKPYQAPVLDVHGEAKFSGPDPVQFDRRPVIFNPTTQEYEDFAITPSMTKIPREKPFDYWFGTVTAPATPDYNGVPRYKVDIAPFPNSDVEDNVLVTMWGLEKLNQLANGSILWPIHQSPVDGNFYCKPDLNERLAKTTSVIKARVGNTAGTGTAQIYTMTVPANSTVGTYVANIAGNTQVYSISGTPAGGDGTIAAGVWIIIRKIFSFWHIVAADCSGAA